MTLDVETLYGFYSQESVNKGNASFVYSTPDGGEVEVTLVNQNKDGWSGYAWKDTVPMGEVVKYLRIGQRDDRWLGRRGRNEQ